MTPRKTHGGDGKPFTPEFQRKVDRLSDLSAYAYGFSDKKPGWSYWIIQAIIAIGAITALLGMWGRA